MTLNFKPEYILDAPMWVQIHLAAAMVALAFGTVMWMRPKGTRGHKFIGRMFIILMLITAFSAIFLREINNGNFSFIHLFVPLTFFASWEAIHYIRKGNIRHHKRAVKGLFFGALLIPGILAFMPGRRLWMLFFSA